MAIKAVSLPNRKSRGTTVADACDCLACRPAPPQTGKYATPICSFIVHLDLRLDEGEFRVARSQIKTKCHMESPIRVIPPAIKRDDHCVWFYACGAAVSGFQTEFRHRIGIASLEWKVFLKQMLDWIDRVRPTEHAFQFFDEASKAHGGLPVICPTGQAQKKWAAAFESATYSSP